MQQITALNQTEAHVPDKQLPAADIHGGTSIKRHPVWLRITLVAAVILAGLAAMQGLAMLKKTPPAQEPVAPEISANGVVVRRQSVPVVLRGYGTARSHRKTEIIPQVSGDIVEINPALETGNVIASGDLLIQIDPSDYQLALEQATAEVERLEQELVLLRQNESNDQRRLELSRQMRNIAQRDYDRIETLVRSGGAESAARLDQELLRLTQEQDRVTQIENALALYESRLNEMRAQIASARSRHARAELDLGRTTIRAPYTARIEMKNVELHQRVTAGQSAVTIADDSVLEVAVSLEGREVARWLGVEPASAEQMWVAGFDSKHATVAWTERPEQTRYAGSLVRVENYNAASRTFNVVIEITRENAMQGTAFPLVDGMFCEVQIEGTTAREIIPIPRSALTTLNTVFISENGRLQTREVVVERLQNEVALIGEGLEDGEMILISRPPRAIDGMKVTVNLLSTDAAIAIE